MQKTGNIFPFAASQELPTLHCLQHWFFKDDSIPPMNTVGSFKSANCRATLIPVLQKVFDSAQLAVSNQVQQAKYVFLMFVVMFDS
jgi:hypothetical protein